MVVPLVMPTAGQSADTDVSTSVAIQATLQPLTAEIVGVQPKKLDLPTVKQVEQPNRVTVKNSVKTKIVTQADPGLAVKRQWVQKAASAYGIDWKILEAVWQVESGKRWHTTVRSSAGAQGPCQFMPTTWRAYAQDGNGDGTKDISYAPDCLFGAAKLLAANGAASGNVTNALLRYNFSMSYVKKVIQIANSIED
jgi:membrane-bound lytic murein transglycosylase B